MTACGIISVDVEDYFHVQGFPDAADRNAWPGFPSRVEENTEHLLDLFEEHRVKATFFVLGWAAESHPELIQQIAARGHELACHSYWHRPVVTLTLDEFRADTLRAKDIIEQAAGVPIYGYRAPGFSITERSLWALEVLVELGFKYDSSIFPIRHDQYGIRDAARGPFRVETRSGSILEFPLATFRFKGTPNLPVAGGGYLRMLPSWYTRAGVKQAWREGLTVVSYIHPWELDPESPRLDGPLKSRLRQYTGLKHTEARLAKLLSLGRFSSFRDSGLVSLAPSNAFKEVAAP